MMDFALELGVGKWQFVPLSVAFGGKGTMVVHTFLVSFLVELFNFGVDVATAFSVRFFTGNIIIFFATFENDVVQFLQVWPYECIILDELLLYLCR